MKEKLIKDLDKIINKFILEGSKFVEYSAFAYGYMDYMITNEINSKFTYDYEYFAFTKSTKTLKSIRALLKEDLNEDSLILVRSLFDNYLSCRFLNEFPDKVVDFIVNPIKLAYAVYNIKENKIYNREDVIVGEIDNPNKLKLGSDKKYYYNFYDFLSRYSHCSSGIFDCYVDENNYFTISKVNYELITRLFTVFVYSRLFEHVVTVEGEDFKDQRTEKRCYQLVSSSIQLLETTLDYCVLEYSNPKDKSYQFQYKRMRELFKEMKKALKEELGSFKKTK